MPLVLAIGADERQAPILERIVRDHVGAEFHPVDSLDAAAASLTTRIPDVVLVSALTPDEDRALRERLSVFGGDIRTEILAIPQFATTDEEGDRGRRKSRKKKRGLLSAGSEPEAFAQVILALLGRPQELGDAGADPDPTEVDAELDWPGPEAIQQAEHAGQLDELWEGESPADTREQTSDGDLAPELWNTAIAEAAHAIDVETAGFDLTTLDRDAAQLDAEALLPEADVWDGGDSPALLGDLLEPGVIPGEPQEFLEAAAVSAEPDWLALEGDARGEPEHAHVTPDMTAPAPTDRDLAARPAYDGLASGPAGDPLQSSGAPDPEQLQEDLLAAARATALRRLEEKARKAALARASRRVVPESSQDSVLVSAASAADPEVLPLTTPTKRIQRVVPRLLPVDAWARVIRSTASSGEEVAGSPLQALIAGLSVPTPVAVVAYPIGCRLRRVRVRAIPAADDDVRQAAAR